MLLVTFLLYGAALSIGLWRKGVRAAGRQTLSPRPTDAVPPASVAPSPTLRLLVVGATGGTGRQLVSQALERGYRVTALVRTPAALTQVHERLRVVRGDVLDSGSLATAMQDQDAVVSALGHRRFFGPSRIQSDGTLNVLQAMERHGVTRFVCETSLGLGDSAFRQGLWATFFITPLILPFYFWDKARQEHAIAQSRADWVIVRPGRLTNGPRRGTWRSGLRVGSFIRGSKISRADVAAFMLDQVTDDAYLKSTPGVCW